MPGRPSEKELVALENRLDALRTSSSGLQQLLDGLLADHADLLRNYRSLQSEYDKEKTDSEKCKRIAQTNVRNQYILVIVDANTFSFQDRLLTAGPEGGQEAAKLLLGCVRATMARLGLKEGFRVIVRIFADFSPLTKRLAAKTTTNARPLSFGGFVAGFNGSEPLFDVVTAGDVRQRNTSGGNAKVIETFRTFAGTSQCGHIVLGACDSPELLDMLRPFRGRRDKITLLRTPTPSPELRELGFGIDDYADVFSTSSDHDADTTRPPIWWPTESPLERQSIPLSSAPDPPQRISDTRSPESATEDTITLKKAAVWRPTVRIHPDSKDPADKLPIRDATNRYLIPINKAGDRIDMYLPRSTPQELHQYHDRANKKKLCNDHHLLGFCRKGHECAFDHSPITEVIRRVQKGYCREYPCPLKNSCRRQDCVYGHVCLRYGCPGPGIYCRMLPSMHKISFDVAEWVEPYGTGRTDENDIGWLAKAERERVHGIKELKYRPAPYKGRSDLKGPRKIRSGPDTSSAAEFTDDFITPSDSEDFPQIDDNLTEENLIDLDDFDRVSNADTQPGISTNKTDAEDEAENRSGLWYGEAS